MRYEAEDKCAERVVKFKTKLGNVIIPIPLGEVRVLLVKIQIVVWDWT